MRTSSILDDVSKLTAKAEEIRAEIAEQERLVARVAAAKDELRRRIASARKRITAGAPPARFAQSPRQQIEELEMVLTLLTEAPDLIRAGRPVGWLGNDSVLRILNSACPGRPDAPMVQVGDASILRGGPLVLTNSDETPGSWHKALAAGDELLRLLLAQGELDIEFRERLEGAGERKLFEYVTGGGLYLNRTANGSHWGYRAGSIVALDRHELRRWSEPPGRTFRLLTDDEVAALDLDALAPYESQLLATMRQHQTATAQVA